MAIESKDTWVLANDAYHGTGMFADGSVLQQFSRESSEKYTTRKEQNSNEYENVMVSKISTYNGYLWKTEPVRDYSSDVIATIVKDADFQGNDMDQFLSDFSAEAKVRGVNLVLVEQPQLLPEDAQTQLDERQFPYLVQILPERIINYKLDINGNFEYVAFSDTLDLSTFEKEDVQEIVRYYDKEVWRIYKDDQKTILEEGIHGALQCPVLIFSEKGEVDSTGEFTQIGGLSRKLFNLYSELKLMMRGQTFSILTFHTERGEAPELDLGVDNAMYYTGDIAPSFISSDSSQAATYEERIKQTLLSMDRVSYSTTDATSGATTATELRLRMQSLNASLSMFANSLESFERKIWLVISNITGVEIPKIVYNKDFNITDVMSDIEVLQSIDLIADLPTYRSTKLKTIVTEDLTGADEELLNKIYREIDTNAVESTAAQTYSGNADLDDSFGDAIPTKTVK